MILLLVLVHECGHLAVALYFKWNSGKIVIYPFGGCCKFDEIVNRSLKEELIILFGGPFVQIVFCYIMGYLSMKGFMTYRNYLIFKNYHYTLLIFNLLPIFPLDGGRILNIILNYLLPFKKGNRIAIYVSMLFILFALFVYKSLNFTLMGLLLISELLRYLKNQDFLYNRLLLERFINNIYFDKLRIIYSKDDIYKGCRHLIFLNNKYVTERSYLRERFKVK